MNQTKATDDKLQKNNYFLKKVYRKYMLTSVAAMLLTGLCSFVDTIIVGNFTNEAGLSAMSLISPVYLIFYTLGAILGIGGSIAANIYIGKGNYQTYRKIFTIAFKLSLICGVVFVLLGYILLNPFSALLGHGQYEAQIKDYLIYYLPGGAFTLISYMPLYFLKTDGRPKQSTLLFVLFSVLNIGLTLLFLSPVFNMGIKGAGLANTIAMLVTAIAGMIVLYSGSETRLVKAKFEKKYVKEILVTGLPNGLNNLCDAVKIILVNVIIMSISMSSALTVFTVVRNVSDIVSCILLGIGAAILPMIGVFYGERDNASIRTIFGQSVKYGAAALLIIVAVILIIPEKIPPLFGITNAQSIAQTCFALRAMAISLIFAFFNILLAGYFSTIQKTLLSDFIIILRLVVFIAAFCFPLASGFGQNGIWIGFILAEAATFVVTAITCVIIRKKNTKLDMLLLDLSNDESNEITFSVKNTLENIPDASEKASAFCEENGVDMKKSIKAGLFVEEMLTIIISKCMDEKKEQFIDIRVKLFEDDIMIRIRNTGKIFDPVLYYEQNKDNEDMFDELLGLQILNKTANVVDFRKTFGVNNLLIMF